MSGPGSLSVRLSAERLEDRDLPAAPFATFPIVPEIDSGMQIRLQEIAELGRERGLRTNAFMKVGDSITSTLTSQAFYPLGQFGYSLTANGLLGRPDLERTLAIYQSPASGIGENSWSRTSSAAFPGYRSLDVLPLIPGEAAAVRPAISLIMIGTNDATHLSEQVYEDHLRRIIDVHLGLGIIPVLSTIPPMTIQGGVYQGWAASVNQTVVDVAEEYDLPVWNYWAAMIPLPFQGIGDGIHPNVAPQGGGYFGLGLGFGYNVRNYTALEVLTKIRSVVFEGGRPDRYDVPPGQAWLPLLPGQPVIATAGVPGSAPLVAIRDPQTGAVLNQFLAFEPSFAGGVSVAIADLNGDLIQDIIVAAGPGGGPIVRAISGADGTEFFSFFAFEPTFTGGVTVAVGDLDGNGIAEIIVGSGIGGGPRVRVFNPTTGTITLEFFAFEESFRGGVNVAVGNFGAGIGRAIVATPGAGGGGVAKVFDPFTAAELASFYVFDPSERSGVFLAAGDVNGDGIDDLVIGSGDDSGRVRVLRANDGELVSEFTTPGRGGTRVGVLNGFPGLILASRRDDPGGVVGGYDQFGFRLFGLIDTLDSYFPFGVAVDA